MRHMFDLGRMTDKDRRPAPDLTTLDKVSVI